MKPISFPEQNVVYAENQKQYHPLPAHRTPEGIVVSCWGLSWWQRLTLLATGRVWVLTLTFGDPLQPLSLQTERPFAPAAQTPEPAQ